MLEKIQVPAIVPITVIGSLKVSIFSLKNEVTLPKNEASLASSREYRLNDISSAGI